MYSKKLIKLIDYSVDLIRKAEPVALRLSPRGFNLAFSGGKDSQVLYELVKMAGVKYHAEFMVSTVDPIDQIHFIKRYYPDVHFNIPKLTMRQLIERQGILPTRMARFCCAYYKETAGAGEVTLIGIRAQESYSRSKRHEVETSRGRQALHIDDGNLYKATDDGNQLYGDARETAIYCVKGKDKITVAPIIHWTERDVLNFLKESKIPMCETYGLGIKRLGCLICPMSTPTQKRLLTRLYPYVRDKIYVPAIQTLMDKGKYSNFSNAQDVYDWWISDLTVDEYEARRNQYDDFYDRQHADNERHQNDT